MSYKMFKSMRKYNKILLWLVAFIAFSANATNQYETPDTPPNVVFIICDQMRGDALSCLNHPNARTPHLDQMASQGVLFENFFSNSPVCTPSRMTYFTGLYPHQHGTLSLPNHRGKYSSPTKYINSLENSMLGYFRNRGYRLGWIGKNHTYLNETLDSIDVVNIRTREPFRAYNKFVPPHWHSDLLWPEELSYASQNTKQGIEFINDAKKGEPFFLHLSYFDPHPPYMAPAEYTSQYCSDEIALPPFVPPAKLSSRLDAYYRSLQYDKMTEADLKETMRYYYASVAWGVDHQVGKILKALEEKGLSENTIVVFTSEHGDFMGDYHMVRKGMFLYDALLHVPFIVYAPGKIKKGLRTKVMAQGVDLFPTLADMTGGSIPEGLPGRSLKPFLLGQQEDQEDFSVFASAVYSDLPPDYFANPEPLYDPERDVPLHTLIYNRTWKADNRTVMARTREWKLIINETALPELYHMAGIWTEKENVADEPAYKEEFDALQEKIKDVWKW